MMTAPRQIRAAKANQHFRGRRKRMPIDDYRSGLGSFWQNLRARVAGWCKPSHPRFALHLFLAALGAGLLLGLAWMATHRIALAFHAPAAADAQSSGAGAPLPTPMAGGKTALSMPSTGSSSLATIEDSAPIVPAAGADPSAELNPETPDAAVDTTSAAIPPADASIGLERNDDNAQRLSADPAQPSHAGQQGEVTLSVQIDEQGNPIQLSVQHSSGSPAVDNAALLELRSRHFPPTLRDGEPVPATLTVPVRVPLSSTSQHPND